MTKPIRRKPKKTLLRVLSPPSRLPSTTEKKATIVVTIQQKKLPSPVQFDIVISNAEQFLKAGRYDEAIDQTSSFMQELQEKAVRVLILEAATWDRKHKYQDELKSAWMMINFAPTNPVGYLIAGRRYIDQGLQERAIEVFNKGLKSVSFSESD